MLAEKVRRWPPGRDLADAPGHAGDAAAAIGREGFQQTEILQEHGIGRENLRRRPARIDAQQQRHQPRDDGGVGGAGEIEPVAPLLRLHPHLALAARHAMRVVLPRLGEGRQLAAHLDQVGIALHPVVEDGEIVADRLHGLGGGGFLGLDEGVGHGEG